MKKMYILIILLLTILITLTGLAFGQLKSNYTAVLEEIQKSKILYLDTLSAIQIMSQDDKYCITKTHLDKQKCLDFYNMKLNKLSEIKNASKGFVNQDLNLSVSAIVSTAESFVKYKIKVINSFQDLGLERFDIAGVYNDTFTYIYETEYYKFSINKIQGHVEEYKKLVQNKKNYSYNNVLQKFEFKKTTNSGFDYNTCLDSIKNRLGFWDRYFISEKELEKIDVSKIDNVSFQPLQECYDHELFNTMNEQTVSKDNFIINHIIPYMKAYSVDEEKEYNRTKSQNDEFSYHKARGYTILNSAHKDIINIQLSLIEN